MSKALGMKIHSFLKYGLIISVLLAIFSFATYKSDAIVGKWESPDKDRRIEVYKKDNFYFGKIIWQKPDKFRAEVGDIVIRDIEYQNPHWEGKIWVPEIKSDFTANISLPTHNELRVEATNGFIKKVKVWNRVK
ncbi:DUF2147 domain-containing protein [Flavobacterium sp. NRK F10]|uniref:DUF2147 domain-containing protein n=1 Tax=Flavobacterium TaxID=237 RepID=UPI0011B1F55D|nr:MULTISPECIES: DUF2147 domain-containing protein [Flavobacterium]MCO6175605.1 DUF2147 domain-containing protein [Flavobacterium sp. NRK F10]